ncbi:MAG: lamin tail domain-containing protein [Bacteroidetes bacterium]|nr:lamin tail domain-containing protein [Bacteroidota bacterium]
MKKILPFFIILSFLTADCFSQTLTELVVPQFFGAKTTGTANNARTPFAVCIQITGLLPATTYDLKLGLALLSETATSYGAGNVWTGGSFQNANILNAFQTNSTGCSAPVWLFFQPTGNGSRFDAGQVHNLRIGYAINGNSMPGQPSFIGTKTLTALDISNTPRTQSILDDGAFIKGSAMPGASGKYVLLFNNISGTGDPLFAYMIRQATPVQSSYAELPATVNEIYMQSGTSTTGDYPAIIPTGVNNIAGVQRIESRNSDNSLYAVSTDPDGIWPSGANTTTPLRREVVYITATDAPLVPANLPPVVITGTITNISDHSATTWGNVQNDGGAAITERGICWDVLPYPDTSGNHSSDSGTLGMYQINLNGLFSNTMYYQRAYAINSAGISFGVDSNFTTLCEPFPPLPDFIASDTNIFTGDSITFTDSSQFCPVSWNWSFVGGFPMTSDIRDPPWIHYYYPGVFNVCLTTTNNYGTITKCRMGYITVTEPIIPKVVITEISYNPPEHGTDSLEYIELYNNDTTAVNLENFYFSEGVQYIFPSYLLASHSFVVIAKKADAMLHTFNDTVLQWTSGTLSNSGELIRLKDTFNNTIDSVFYDNTGPWDILANGMGPSLELCNPDDDNALGENWRHAIEFQAINSNGDSIWGSPGYGCSYSPEAEFIADDTVINTGEFVTFTDVSTGNPDSWDWTFEGGIPSGYSGEFPDPVEYITSGTYCVTLTVANALGNSTKIKDNWIEVGITSEKENEPSPRFTIFPNPNPGLFYIVSEPGVNWQLKMISPLGIVLKQEIIDQQLTKLEYNGIEKGIYYIQIVNPGTMLKRIKKIIIF